MGGVGDRSTEPGRYDPPRSSVQAKQIVLLHGKLGAGRRVVTLGYEPVAIGRDAQPGAICIADTEASRRHAVLVLDRATQGWSIEDQGSRNGIYVDGRKVTHEVLRPGAVIRIGKTLFLYHEPQLDDDRPLRPEEAPLLGASRAMQHLRGEIELVAATPIPVLVLGETGVGKDLVAQELHRRSGRTGPFVPVNCAAIPADLAESELFGHTAGSFSGALRGVEGLFQTADGGTLFLDEVGELPPAIQPKLLRALATGEVRAVGAASSRNVAVRVIAATNRDLAAQVAAETFRPDLFSRLAGCVIDVAPLRARRDDILPIAEAILRRTGVYALTADAAEALLLHAWPYNVRELEQVLATACARANGHGWQITCQHLPEVIAELVSRRAPAPAAEQEPVPLATLVPRDTTPTREELCVVLERLEGNVVAVASYFGKDRRQIYRWAQRAGIDLETFRRD